MLTKRLFSVLSAAFLFLAAIPASATVTTGKLQSPEDFTGVLLDGSNDATIPFTLHVDSFSTAADVGQLSRLMGDQGQLAVASALHEMKARGWIRLGSMLGYEVPIIRSFTTNKGQTIFAVLDRPIPIWEQLHATRSAAYPFGMVEFKVKPDGNGKGELVAAARAMFAKDGQISLIGYGTKPYEIIGVSEQPATK